MTLRTALIEKQKEQELERLRFIINTRCLNDAIYFAKQTLKGYKKALLNKNHFASSREYKPKFIASCIIFKKFLHNPYLFLANEM